MKMFKKGLCLLGFVLCAALNLAAQTGRGPERESARIYSAEGNDFAITLGNERIVYQAAAFRGEMILDPSIAQSGLHTGIHTSQGTSLEIRLVPSGTLIRLSENTSLIYNGFNVDGNFVDLGLLHGSIRVLAGNEARSARMNPVAVRCGGVTAWLAEGDMGIDYSLAPEAGNPVRQPLFRVSAFQGSVEVFPYGREGGEAYFGGGQALEVKHGEWLSMDISSPLTQVERGLLLDRTILPYLPRIPIPVATPLPEVPPPETPLAETPEEELVLPMPSIIPPEQIRAAQLRPIVNNHAKNATVALGLILTASSLIAQGITYFYFDVHNNTAARNTYMAAYAPMGIGLAVTLTGILINPPLSYR